MPMAEGKMPPAQAAASDHHHVCKWSTCAAYVIYRYGDCATIGKLSIIRSLLYAIYYIDPISKEIVQQRRCH